ncbi:hypothetical protein Neosp_011306 [[Neocosmospora] mangrovei]
MVSKRRVAAIGKVFQYTPDSPTQDKKKKKMDDDDDGDEDTDSEDDNQETGEANPDTSTKADKMNTVAKLIKANDTQIPTLTQKDIDHLFSMNLFLKDFLLGRGFNSLLLRDEIDDLTSQLSQTALHPADGGRSLPQMPKVDFFHGTDLHMVEMVLSRLRPDAKDQFIKYVKLIPLGLIGIFGFAGSSKTEILAITAHLFLTKFSLVYASALTHVATTNFASRCYRVGRGIAEAYNNTAPANTQRHTIPLVVRGYDFHTELWAFHYVVEKKSPDIDLSEGFGRWDIKLSLSEWLLKVFKVDGWDPDPLNHPILFTLRQNFNEEPAYEDLRTFTRCRITGGPNEPGDLESLLHPPSGPAIFTKP